MTFDLTPWLTKHARIGLQFSGGKDSLAVLHLVRPWWDRLTVYWCNPGDPFPEMLDYMKRVASLVPHFKEVPGRVQEVRAALGWPSDVVPTSYNVFHVASGSGAPFLIQDRASCCVESMMRPLHEAVIADGVTLLLRGQRLEDSLRAPFRSGYVDPQSGIEILFPIETWTTEAVFDYLASVGAELPPFYEHVEASLDCMNCTAYWGERRGRYLAARHPQAYSDYIARVTAIKQAVLDELQTCEV